MKKLIGNGLSLLHQREDLKKYNLGDFESLPPITRLFYYYYNVGSKNYVDRNILKNNEGLELFKGRRRIDCGVMREFWFEGVCFDENKNEYDNYVGKIFKYETIKKSIENYKKGIKDIDDEGYIHIGYMTAYGDWLMLGVEDYNKDQIFIYGSSFDKIQKISDNIFELFTMFNRYWDDEDIIDYTEGKYSGKDVYREWGEAEWRIRGIEPEKREDWEKDETMLLKRGLGLLKQRSDYPEQMESILSKMPFRARIFYKYYNTGSYEEMFNVVPYELLLSDGSTGLVVEDRWWEGMVIEDEEKFYNKYKFKHTFKRLYTFEELEEEFERYKKKTDSMHLDRYMYIGEMEGHEKILLGVSGSVKDRVLLYGWGGYTIGFEDIFDFFTNVNRYWSDKEIIKATNEEKSGKDNYQNWGEDFWRIRE